MKKMNFKEFRIPSGISRTDWQTMDVREQVADLLYTHVKRHQGAPACLQDTGQYRRRPSSAMRKPGWCGM